MKLFNKRRKWFKYSERKPELGALIVIRFHGALGANYDFAYYKGEWSYL